MNESLIQLFRLSRRMVGKSQQPNQDGNIDRQTVLGFGREWASYDQTKFVGESFEKAFAAYFELLPFDDLVSGEGFDLGCGSGRWAAAVAPRVGLLHCIDPAAEALEVARRRLKQVSNVRFHLASADTMPLEDSSQDFGYSLGVLHHVPNPSRALRNCVRKLKVGAPFLLYLYYRLETRPVWYRAVWKMSDLGRQVVSRLPFSIRKFVTSVIAGCIYWPLARTSKVLEAFHIDTSIFPLSGYRNTTFYTMRTDALDRFGTRLEQRFTQDEIRQMMVKAGLNNIRFREEMPFWIACGTRHG